MNTLPKYVASRTLENLEWSNSHLIRGDIVDEVARLKQEPGQDILIAGSGALARSLMRNDLIDEYRLLVYPVVLGSGKRLFTDGIMATLRLMESKSFGSGVLSVTYRPASK